MPNIRHFTPALVLKCHNKNMTSLFFEHDISDYLHVSPHFQAIVSDEPFPECGLEFPVGCVKKDMRVDSLSDAVELLQTLRYWLLPELLENATELMNFCFKHAGAPDVDDALCAFVKDFPFLKDLLCVARNALRLQLLMAVDLNRATIVKYLLEVRRLPVDDFAGRIAARKCNLECLKYLVSAGLPMTYHHVADSIIHGHLPVLQYWLDQGTKLYPSSFVLCASHGNLNCLKLLIDRKFPIDQMFTLTEAFFLAAENGHIDCLEYMWKNCDISGDICYEQYILRGATEGAQLNVFKFAVENDFPVAYYQPYLKSLLDEEATDCLEYLSSVGITL